MDRIVESLLTQGRKKKIKDAETNDAEKKKASKKLPLAPTKTGAESPTPR